MSDTRNSFEQFWPAYVRAHANKTNRTLHVVGISLALACVAAAIVKKRPALLLLAPVLAYGFAFAGHFFVEHNAPQTFSHPIHSLRAALLLYWKTLCGDMEAEVQRVLDEAARAASGDDAGAVSGERAASEVASPPAPAAGTSAYVN